MLTHAVGNRTDAFVFLVSPENGERENHKTCEKQTESDGAENGVSNMALDGLNPGAERAQVVKTG